MRIASPAVEEGTSIGSTQVIRESAKWVLASFAAIGATLVAGVQLSDIGSLRSTLRLAVAVAGLVTALGGVTIVILRTARVITIRFLSVREVNLERVRAAKVAPRGLLPSETNALVRALEDEWPTLLPDAPGSLAALAVVQDEVLGALSKLNRGQSVRWRGKTILPANKAEVEGEAERLRSAGERVVGWANAWSARREFESLGRLVVGAGAAITAGLVLFIWAVNPPPETHFAPVEKPTEVTVAFREDALDHVEEGVSDHCVDEGASTTAIAVGGDLRRPVVAIAPEGECPGALISIDEAVGVVIPDV